MAATRPEKDSFGTIEVPAERLWGAQTERSRRYFRISIERMPLAVVYALAQVKRSAARVNEPSSHTAMIARIWRSEMAIRKPDIKRPYILIRLARPGPVTFRVGPPSAASPTPTARTP